MATKSPTNNHSFWGIFATAAALPNSAAAATQDAALEVGDRAWATAPGRVYFCTAAGLGAAVWAAVGVQGTVITEIPIENGVTIAPGDCVASGATLGRCTQMNANADALPDFLGTAIAGGTGNAGGTVVARVATSGRVTDGGAAFAQGALYAPDGTGRPTSAPPANAGDLVFRVGFAYSATEYAIQPGEGVVL